MLEHSTVDKACISSRHVFLLMRAYASFCDCRPGVDETSMLLLTLADNLLMDIVLIVLGTGKRKEASDSV